MRILSLFLLVVLSVAASAQPSGAIRSTTGNETVSFDIPNPGSTYLAFLANDEDASFTFQLNELELWKNGEEKSTQKTYGSFETGRWNLMRISITPKLPTVVIYPRTTYKLQQDPERLWNLRQIILWSNKKIYWTQCTSYHRCNFSGSVLNASECPTVNSATVALTILCGLLVVAAMAALLTRVFRGKLFKIKEAEVNTRPGPTNNHPRRQRDNVTLNSLYGQLDFGNEGISASVSNTHSEHPEAPAVPETIYEEVENSGIRFNNPRTQEEHIYVNTHSETP